MLQKTSCVAALTLALSACNTNPTEGKSTAAVSEALEAPTPAENNAAAEKYLFSQADSKIEFVGAKVTRKHDGAFNVFQGTILLVDGDVTKSSVSAEVDTASLTSDEAKLTAHLKTPDLLDVEKFPKARFTSTSVKAGGADGASHTVTGNFELHGVTKSISFPANIRVTGDGVEVDAEFGINRKDFGIVYPGMPDDLIKDEVLLKLRVRAKKATS